MLCDSSDSEFWSLSLAGALHIEYFLSVDFLECQLCHLLVGGALISLLFDVIYHAAVLN